MAVGLRGEGETGVLGMEVDRERDGRVDAWEAAEMVRESLGLAERSIFDDDKSDDFFFLAQGRAWVAQILMSTGTIAT